MSREAIERLLEKRVECMLTTAGEHDAKVALLACKRLGDYRNLRYELRALPGAPSAYARAFLDTVLAGLS